MRAPRFYVSMTREDGIAAYQAILAELQVGPDGQDKVVAPAGRRNGDAKIVVTSRMPKQSQGFFGEGLGDTIASLTKAVGIKPCGGCEKRRRALNRLVPWRRSNGNQSLDQHGR